MDPVLVLEPLNASFERKVLNVASPVKIGRKVSQKVSPEVTNGLFESKVLSRNHAEMGRLEDGTFYVQDLGSSNGTFVNGVRLSDEGMTSEKHPLNNEDKIDFGVDILKDDNESK
ncbi:SMAD/FHA domain-containing protein [Hyaloraphidium curvatum]|nr:SMAD/FHA domain-containing protein [Hyaloraphidium curvatum]